MIVYITQELDGRKYGGVALAGYDFLQVLKRKYGKVIVITTKTYKKQTLDFDYLNCEEEDVYLLSSELNYKIKSFRDLIIFIYRFIQSLLKKKKINLQELKQKYPIDSNDIIYVNSWSSIFTSGRITGMDHFKKVVCVHGNPESFIWQNNFESSPEIAIKNAALYLDQFENHIYVSEVGLNSWSKYLERSTIKKFYLPNKGDDSLIKSVLTKNRNILDPKYYNVVVVGSVQKRKAQDILLNIFPAISNEIPNIKFHIIGGISNRWGGLKIKNQIEQSQFKKYFKFYGHRDDSLVFIQSADLVLFTSRAEAFPITVLEYMALGKPIVASNVSGVPEMIVNNINGLLYNNEDTNKIIDSIVQLYTDKMFASKLANQAKLDYTKKFSTQQYLTNALYIINEINN